MKSAIVVTALAFATCSTFQPGDPPPSVVVDAGSLTGDAATCQLACAHLHDLCGVGDTCFDTCRATWGTNTGGVIDWSCAAKQVDKQHLQGCGLNICQ